MKTITFDEVKAKQIENAVSCVFDCKLYDIFGYVDTLPKKVVVFLLSVLEGYDKRTLGKAYQMTYLFVPTVIEAMELKVSSDNDFRDKISNVINKLGYENILDQRTAAAS